MSRSAAKHDTLAVFNNSSAAHTPAPVAIYLARCRRCCCCCCCCCRLCFPHIIAVTQRLIDSLAASGPDAVHDMDLVAQQITVDVIGMAAFDRDLEATVRKPAADQQKQQQQQCCAAGSSSADKRKEGSWLDGSNGSSSSSSSSGGRGITGRGVEVVTVMRHLVVAMQSRNNPLNRWFPWRKVRSNWRQQSSSSCSLSQM
jgi:hypothetical protein